MSNNKQKEKLINHYKNCLAEMISDKDFQRFFGAGVASKVIKYGDLDNFKSIDDLLPNEKDFAIILTETKRNEGHWCAILKYDGLIEWFDSYGGKGGKPDGELSFISKAMNVLLDQDDRYLTKLLKESGRKIIYNKEKFQAFQDGISTCGKWVIARILMFQMGYNLKEFQDKINQKMIETGKPYDILICDWII